MPIERRTRGQLQRSRLTDWSVCYLIAAISSLLYTASLIDAISSLLSAQGKKYAEAVEKREMCLTAVECDNIDADILQDSPGT